MASLVEDLNAYLTALTDGTAQNIFVSITNYYESTADTSIDANYWTSFWRYNKTYGGYGSAPTTAAVPTNATAGGLLQVNASSGKTLLLTGISGVPGQDMSWMFYDRLIHMAGLSGTSTSAQAVGGVLTRNTTGAGNSIWLEIQDSQVGATARTATVSYTNQSGTAGRSGTCQIGGTGLREEHRLIPVTLQQGDTGVRSVETVTLSASTGTAGNFGVVIGKRIATIGSGLGVSEDFLGGKGFPVVIPDNACIAYAGLCQPSSVTAFKADFSAHFIEVTTV